MFSRKENLGGVPFHNDHLLQVSSNWIYLVINAFRILYHDQKKIYLVDLIQIQNLKKKFQLPQFLGDSSGLYMF